MKGKTVFCSALCGAVDFVIVAIRYKKYTILIHIST